MNTIKIILTLGITFLLSSQLFSQAPVISTRVNSLAAGSTGLYVEITPPITERYPDGAPVVVNVDGGFDAAMVKSSNFQGASYGFITIRFNFPGGGTAATRSGGVYDHRGLTCIKALKDIVLFALNALPDTGGSYLRDLVAPIVPLGDNVGIGAYSNGGNASITVCGVYGQLFDSLAWVGNWESPVGEGMVNADAGTYSRRAGIYTNPQVNPAYDTLTGEWDTLKIAWCDTLYTSDTQALAAGGFYYDINSNGIVDEGSDFILTPLSYNGKEYYSLTVIKEAVRRSLLPSPLPSHIPDLAETRAFWKWRDASNWIDSAAVKLPDLKFIVTSSERDHVQAAPNFPHVHTQYMGFVNAGIGFARLNGDRAYLEELHGSPVPGSADNDAFTVFDYTDIRNAVQPSGTGLSNGEVFSAGILELADRTYYGITDVNLSDVLRADEEPEAVPSSFVLSSNYPEPFNPVTRIKASVPERGFLEAAVYNVNGQLVEVIQTKVLDTGNHIISWNAADVSSGVYFCVVKFISESDARVYYRTEKLVLIK